MARPDPGWSFLTNHALALLVIADDPRARMRDIAEAIGVTERTAQRIVGDLIDAGYALSDRPGRRNIYTLQADLPVRMPLERDVEIGEFLALLAPTGTAAAARHSSARDHRADEGARERSPAAEA